MGIRGNAIEIRRKKAARVIRVLRRLYPRAKVFLDFRTPWELLVAVILSAQCTDKKVNEVTRRLFSKYQTFDAYLAVRPSAFEKDIMPTGFYRTKTRHILRAAKMIKRRFAGKVPRTMEELLTLPGVGRKTANVVLQNAYDVVQGIPVDTHVRRLARLWGLSAHRDPDKIEQDLLLAIPRSEWKPFSYRAIAYGREYCPSRPHDHARCPISGKVEYTA